VSNTTFLYRHFDSSGKLLYIGISLNAAARLSQHKDHSGWFKNITRVDIEKFEDRMSALTAEREAIRIENPEHNIRHNKTMLEPPILYAAETSKQKLTRSVVFQVIYSVQEVSKFLGIGMTAVRRLLDAGELGYITFPAKEPITSSGKIHYFKPPIRITGWQLIDYLESRVHHQAAISGNDK